MFKKSPLKSVRLIKQKRRILILKSSALVIGIIILIALSSYLTKLPSLLITSVSVVGNSSVDSDSLVHIAQADISGNYAMLYSRANRFLYSKQKIETEILASNKRINTASLDVKGHDLIITIQERTPSYTWCSGMPNATSIKKCYFIDLGGYVFSEAPTFSGNAFFAFYGIINQDNPIGSTYLGSTEFKAIDQLISFLENNHLHPYAFVASEDGIYNLYLEQGGKIIFKKNQEVPLLVSTLDLIIKNTTIFTKKATSTLEYVDLRFGNKLYYKRTGDNTLELQN